MKKLVTMIFALFFAISLFAGDGKKNLKANFKAGKMEVKSMNAITFGPEGILFVGDSENAMVFAIDTEDTKEMTVDQVKLNNVDEEIATVLGTTADKIVIQDMAVNPLSKKIYFAVHNEEGKPVLLRLANGTFEHVSMKKIKHSKTTINEPVASDAMDKRKRPLRKWAISDLTYYDEQVFVSGLSNQEFGSTFRSIAFPFGEKQMQSSLEIYHAAHGKYETHSPIKAFTAAEVDGKKQLIAGYTCTPLVLFPIDNMKAGEHVKGRTVAELGNWNTPLDMIVMKKEDKQYLLIANSSRALMKITFEDLAKYNGELTTRVEKRSGTAGVDFISLPFVNVLQLDQLNADKFVMLQRKSDGSLNLITQSNRWL